MSRSYRRPFAAITGTASAKDDKRLAHRGVRRKQNLALKTCIDFGNLLLPHRFECHWNDTYNWGRDGAQCYLGSMCDSQDDYSQKYYRKILRKKPAISCSMPCAFSHRGLPCLKRPLGAYHGGYEPRSDSGGYPRCRL